ncbi:MAG: hypothetical protein N2712_04725 [Brevinematales bacterium]|nr:hypothetical protein [Brevinematales bacterium]
MTLGCKVFFKKMLTTTKTFIFLLTTLTFLLGCPQSKKTETSYIPVKDKKNIILNSSSISEVGPIPEWVLILEDQREIQRTIDGTFFIFLLEGNSIQEADAYKELSTYLSYYLPDEKKLTSMLKLELKGKYWQKLNTGKYQTFFKYEITQDSIKEVKRRKNELSEKSRQFVEKLD